MTSANLTAAAQAQNVEIGLVVRQSALARELERHPDALIAAGHLRRLALPNTSASP